MKLSYDKLWAIMRANKMKKCDLEKAAKITKYAMTKMNNDQPVDLSVMMNICKVFHCQLSDVVELIEID